MFEFAIGKTKFSREDAARIYEERKLIVKGDDIYAVFYSAAQKMYYAMRAAHSYDGVPFVRRGYKIVTAAEANEILREKIFRVA